MTEKIKVEIELIKYRLERQYTEYFANPRLSCDEHRKQVDAILADLVGEVRRETAEKDFKAGYDACMEIYEDKIDPDQYADNYFKNYLYEHMRQIEKELEDKP